MSHFVLSVSMSEWHTYHSQFMAFRADNTNPPYSMTTVPSVVRDAVGALLIIDWTTRSVLASTVLPMPQGICVQPGRILAALRGTHEIATLTHHGQHRWSHPHLANLHTIHASTPGRILVSSSATDTLVELDEAGQIRWRWSAFEHGFDTLKSGAPYRFDADRDHRRFVSIAADHPAHINSALDLGDGTVLATFFHQGILVRIRREDGRCTVVREGLRYPHAIRRRAGGFVVSDSLNQRALLLSSDFETVGVIEGGFGWIQDTLVVEGRAFVLSNIKIADPGPASSNRIVSVDLQTGDVLGEMDFGRNQHLFALEPISAAEAAQWVRLWR